LSGSFLVLWPLQVSNVEHIGGSLRWPSRW